MLSRNTAGVVKLSYPLEDHQQSPSNIRDSSGNLIVNESFTAYGTRRNWSTWSGAATSTELTASAGITRQGYTWQTALGNMGLNHMNGRVQDTITGIFLSADPYINEPTNTQNYNRYAYVYNNPLSLTDPSGFWACEQMFGFTFAGTTGSGVYGRSSNGLGGGGTLDMGISDGKGGTIGQYNATTGYLWLPGASTSGPAQVGASGGLEEVTGTANRGSWVYIGALSNAGMTYQSAASGSAAGASGSPQTKQSVSPPRKPCTSTGTVDTFALGASGQTLIDGSVGVALDISKEMPKVASALRGSGGLFALGSIAHGISTGNYAEAAWGALDVTAGVASIFPPADFITGPYFAVRLGMGITELAVDTANSESTCGVQ